MLKFLNKILHIALSSALARFPITLFHWLLTQKTISVIVRELTIKEHNLVDLPRAILERNSGQFIFIEETPQCLIDSTCQVVKSSRYQIAIVGFTTTRAPKPMLRVFPAGKDKVYIFQRPILSRTGIFKWHRTPLRYFLSKRVAWCLPFLIYLFGKSKKSKILFGRCNAFLQIAVLYIG